MLNRSLELTNVSSGPLAQTQKQKRKRKQKQKQKQHGIGTYQVPHERRMCKTVFLPLLTLAFPTSACLSPQVLEIPITKPKFKAFQLLG